MSKDQERRVERKKQLQKESMILLNRYHLYLAEERSGTMGDSKNKKGKCDVLDIVLKDLARIIKMSKKEQPFQTLARVKRYAQFLEKRQREVKAIGPYNKGFRETLDPIVADLELLTSDSVGVEDEAVSLLMPSNIDPALMKKILDDFK